MSLSHKGTVVNLQDRRDRNSANRGGLGRSGSNAVGGAGGGTKGGGPKGPKDTALSLPPLRPWDGSFPFDLIREITSPDLLDNIPKYDYYRVTNAKDTPSVSLYHVPCYLLHHIANLAKVSPTRSHSRDSMFSAAVLHGSKRFYSSSEYLALAREHTRFSDACMAEQIDVADLDDIHALLKSIRPLETDCGQGYKVRVNYRVPEHVHLQILPPDRDLLPLSQSLLWVRFYMDALRETPDGIPARHLSAMNETVEHLYEKVGRLARRLEIYLDGLEIEPAKE